MFEDEISDKTKNPQDNEPCMRGGVSVIVLGGNKENQRSEHASTDCGSERGIIGDHCPAPLCVLIPQFEFEIEMPLVDWKGRRFKRWWMIQFERRMT